MKILGNIKNKDCKKEFYTVDIKHIRRRIGCM